MFRLFELIICLLAYYCRPDEIGPSVPVCLNDHISKYILFFFYLQFLNLLCYLFGTLVFRYETVWRLAVFLCLQSPKTRSVALKCLLFSWIWACFLSHSFGFYVFHPKWRFSTIRCCLPRRYWCRVSMVLLFFFWKEKTI